MTLACLDGTIVDESQAVIPATDEGLLRGDGVFEVMRLYDSRPFAIDDHLERMERSAANLRLPLDVADVRADVEALLAAESPGDALVRVLVTRGGHRLALIEPLPDMPESMSLGYVTYAPTRVLDGVKSLSYGGNMLASRLARERGFDEALLVTPHGRVLEAPTSSFFWVRAGELFTPPLSDHLLDSITRRRLMEVTDTSERVTTPDDLRTADEAFLASSVREALSVHAIEDIQLPGDGPLTVEARGRLRERIEAELAG
ncbi:MAG: branched-chain amino acid aminotransferase [Solirubrobacteraceae bacterium]|jgi:branched-chain amino acid aminotransferase|nr:branched-chain amino acid aminotransferase [Solirubrobacteraceae bacterium]